MTATAQAPLQAGFDDPVLDSQACFRVVLDAMAQPGRISALAAGKMPLDLAVPEPLQPVMAGLCLTLLDLDTNLWLDPAAALSEALRRYLAFHCGCPIVATPADADFALVTDPRAMPPLADFRQGSAEYPDRSTTILLQVERLTNGEGATLRGPGIEDSRRFGASPLPSDFWSQVQSNRALFPCGVDVIFAAPAAVAALPRSTRVEML